MVQNKNTQEAAFSTEKRDEWNKDIYAEEKINISQIRDCLGTMAQE